MVSFAVATMALPLSFSQRHIGRTCATVAVEVQSTHKPKRMMSQGNDGNALLKEALNQSGISLVSNSYASLLESCTNLKALQQVHAHIFTSGLNQNIFLGTKVLSMYAMLGAMENARLAFDKINRDNVFLWNVMIRGYVTYGPCEKALPLYYQMQREGVHPDNFTFPFVLKACAGMLTLQEGREIHDRIVSAGFEEDVFVANSLIAMYARCGSVEIARQTFDKMSKRNEVSWNAMIAGYAQNGHDNEALTLFYEMLHAEVIPNTITMVSALQACGHLRALQQGKCIHDYITRSGFDSNVLVANSLVAMYAKCGRIEMARHVFDRMAKRDVVSWNAMIDGYAENGYPDEALILFHQMQLEKMKPSLVTVVNVLSACGHLASLQQGKWVHNYIIRSGFGSNVFVGNSLVVMYAKCGTIEDAQELFDKMSIRDLISWNAMIAGYAQGGHGSEALRLFYKMQQAEVTSDSVTIVSVLQACAHLRALQQGKQIHRYIIVSGLESDVFVGTALIDMYAKCGRIEIAHQVFDKMSERDVVSWNAMIASNAQSGQANEALTLFHQMQLAGFTPNLVTMVSVLQACVHLAALQQGKWIHSYIIISGLEPNNVVRTALIDMYAKCGSIAMARQLFDKMRNRNVISWSAMIAGYGMHGHGEDAVTLFLQMQQTGLKPNHITFVSVLSACSHAGLVDEGWQCFNCMIQDYCITPRLEHYACMVDLLGRAGRLDEAQEFIKQMPLEPGFSVWGALLGACRIHCNIELGCHVAEHLFNLQPENAGCYVLMSNIYAAAGRWEDVTKVRTMMKDRGLRKTPGCSFIEVNNRIHAFLVGDRSHPQSEKIYAMLETLAVWMKEAGYEPDMNFVLHDVEEEVKEHMLSSHSEKLAIAFGLISTTSGTPIQITKNLRVCGDCHSATKFISKIVKREIIMRDANRFHHFKDGLCSCRDYW